MAITNQERVGKALELLRAGLAPFVDREVHEAVRKGTINMDTVRRFAEDPMLASKPIAQWDAAGLLKLMWDSWNDVFRRTLGPAERGLVGEIRGHRNRWAHQEPFSGDDADRALDSIARLLAAVSAPEADAVNKMKMELRRQIFDEQMRSERRKAGRSLVEAAAAGLKPWREVVTPHPDVASGRYQQAEFAADLWQVHLNEGADEYRNPEEFFRRTYITESLKQLLVGAVRRLTGGGGDPVVQLQTNFGGGKTHSMLALYHLFSGTAPGSLPGIDAIMAEAGVKDLPSAKRVVLVGNKISPGNPVTKPDGTVVRTLWGELAWQLGGRAAYERIAADDERATSPGDALRQLMNDYGPCLILIDEWVAYARQLHDASDLPAGSFETQFSFAQALTESAKLANNALLVISLPASDTAGSPHTQADDVEVGGVRGREALDRLRNVIGRVESSWRPASAEEGFEIVRRRLFQPMTDPAQFRDRDVVARAFVELYRQNRQEFPAECAESDYEKRLRAAYPIHPEIFDRLYGDWSTLVKFQRTRGVLRLMAAVIHALWEKGDRTPLIMPSTIPIDDPRVQFELTRYLSDNWVPVIERDVDGGNSLPLKLDGEVPNLGKLHACRRVARTIYLGSAPTAGAAHRGLEDRRVRLGCVMPGESPAVFGDALRRLAASATYLYQDGTRFWYSTQPTVTKLAEDRAEELRRDPDKVSEELERRLRAETGGNKRGDFGGVHVMPRTSGDVPDGLEARLVVLGPEQAYSRDKGNAAETAARTLLESRGTAPRLYRNTLVFLAPDKARLQDLDEALRRFLAWDSIVAEKEALNLDPHQTRQAETQRQAADSAIVARLPEAYRWLLVPTQASPQQPDITWEALQLNGSDGLVARAVKKLRHEDLFFTTLAPSRLKHELDRVPLWRNGHVAIRQLIEDFARYTYLPRLAGPGVLVNAVAQGLALLTWQQDAFAYADSYDEAAQRYRGLRCGQQVDIPEDGGDGLLVRPEVAQRQREQEVPESPGSPEPTPAPPPGPGGPGAGTQPEPGPGAGKGPRLLRRFHGSVTLDSTRVGRDAGRIADEVIAHLAGLVGADVTVTLEIEAHIPSGAPDHVVRTVTENSRTLKFRDFGFEEE